MYNGIDFLAGVVNECVPPPQPCPENVGMAEMPETVTFIAAIGHGIFRAFQSGRHIAWGSLSYAGSR
jgi:hypothetical protein